MGGKWESFGLKELLNHRSFLMEAQSSVKTQILLDVGEDSFEGIGGVGNLEMRIAEVGEDMREIPFHTVVGAPKSAMRVVPSSRKIVSRTFLEECSPFVVPEVEPEDELILADLREMTHERLEILSGVQLRIACDVACDDGRLVEVAHLDRHRKSLQ